MTVETGRAASAASLKALAVYGERRSLVMLALGFASGLPNLLIFDTLSAWLRDAGLSLEVIAFFSLATLAYSLQVPLGPWSTAPRCRASTRLAGPSALVDAGLPGLIILGLWLIAGGDPTNNLGVMALLSAVLVGFLSATQDIVIDAWRIEAAPDDNRRAPMAAAYQWGYRIAMIVAGAVPLLLADAYQLEPLLWRDGRPDGGGRRWACWPRRARAQHASAPIHAGDTPLAPALRDRRMAGARWR